MFSALKKRILKPMVTSFAKRHFVSLAVLLVVCLALFANTLQNDFIWDDVHLISENPYIKSVKNIPLFFTPHYWNNLHPFDERGDYRPVRTATFALDYFFWQLNPAGYHLTNLLLHGINVLLVYCFIVFFLQHINNEASASQAQTRWWFSLPFLTALLFAAHPVHTESVSYIKNRSELLCFLFFLSSFMLSVGAMFQASRPRQHLYRFLGLLAFCLSMFSKEVAVILPVTIIFYAICCLSVRGRKAAVINTGPHCIIIVLYFWFGQTALQTTEKISTTLNFTEHVLAVCKTVGYYFYLLVFPVHLNVEHPLDTTGGVLDPAVILPLMAGLMLCVLVGVSYKKSRVLCFGTGWILLALLPAANLIFLASRPIAEQRLYFPSLGICLLLAWGIHRWFDDRRSVISRRSILAVATLLVVCLWFSVKTIQRNVDMRNGMTFFGVAVSATPKSPRAHLNLGIALSQAGQTEDAIRHYRLAIQLDPGQPEAYYNLGLVMKDKGEYDAAVNLFQAARQLAPDTPEGHVGLGTVSFEKKDYDKAIRHYRSALRLDPENVDANYNLGMALTKVGEIGDAGQAFRAVLRQKPDFVRVYANLAVLELCQGRQEAAIKNYNIALRLNPDDALIHNDLGIVLYQVGRVEEAMAHYSEALRLDPDFAAARNNLAIALKHKR